MAGADIELETVRVIDRETWRNGPPHELFARLRSSCPVHWSDGIPGSPDEPGFWSITNPDDVRTVSRDWRTFSSERGITALDTVMPAGLMGSMFIAMDPPKHDRIKALFQAGFTPRRIAAHEDAIRAIVTDVLDGLDTERVCDFVSAVAQPVVSRVIGSFMGIPPEDDETWASLINSALSPNDPDTRSDGAGASRDREFAEIFQRCQTMIDDRRKHPTDDLTSVLVHAEIDGARLEDREIIMGCFLLLAAGNDSTKATCCNGIRALIEYPDQRQILLDDPSLIPGAVEECLRMFPPFTHFRRTATRDVQLGGKTIREGDKVVMWYVSSNRDHNHYGKPDRFDVRRSPEHQAFGGGGRHYCLGTALARLELRILLEETLARFPAMELAGTPTLVQSAFLYQPKSLPVRLLR